MILVLVALLTEPGRDRRLVTVARETGAADPGFTVAVSLNDALFVDTGGSTTGAARTRRHSTAGDVPGRATGRRRRAGPSIALMAIQRWLVTIPLEQAGHRIRRVRGPNDAVAAPPITSDVDPFPDSPSPTHP